MIYASVYDIKRREFPIIAQLLLIGVYLIQFNPNNLWGMLLAIPFFIAAIVTDKMGMGDVKAILLLGGLSGLVKIYGSVFFACLIFIIFGQIKRKGKSMLPFIPFLTAGFIITEIMEVLII